MYDTELYDNFLQRQSSQYSISDMTKTLVVCGAILLNSGSFFQPPARTCLPITKGGSDSYIINKLYSSDSPTWSDVETSVALPEGSTNDIAASFNVLNQLAFLEGDDEAEKEADQFFSQIPVKTKKIMINRRA